MYTADSPYLCQFANIYGISTQFPATLASRGGSPQEMSEGEDREGDYDRCARNSRAEERFGIGAVKKGGWEDEHDHRHAFIETFHILVRTQLTRRVSLRQR